MKQFKFLHSYLFILLMLVTIIGCKKDDDGSGSKETTATDFDGNIYHTVTIGSQVWLKENLNVTHFNNGDPITTTDPSSLDITDSYSANYQWVVGGIEANASVFGRLYTWNAAMDSRGICPEGYHIPTDAEWQVLIDYLGGSSVAGGKMKEEGTTHWYSPNTDGTNTSKFTALPGDYRDRNGIMGTPGFFACFWSATTSGTNSAYYYNLDYAFGDVFRVGAYYNHGMSIRCIKDAD